MVLVIGAVGSTAVLAAAVSSSAASSFALAESFGAGNSAGGNTLSASPSTATTGGDLLVAVVRTRSTSGSIQSVTSVSDSNGETWSRAADRASGQGDQSTWYFAGALSLSPSQSVTVTAGTATTTAIAFTVLEVTGATGSPLDVTATNAGNTEPASTGTIPTTAQASEVAIADIGWNGSYTASAQTPGYTFVGAQTSTVKGSAEAEQAAWQLLSATGSQTYGATISSSTVAWTGAIATFKLGVSGPAPAITSFSPGHGTDGTSVTIYGSGFSNGTSSVTFNGTPAGFSVTGDAQISASVPAGATTGPITVATSGGTATSSTAFTVDPTITGFSPTSGPVGASVTITGSGFAGATAVVFNTTNQPTFTVSSDSQIATTVPSGATSGPISVTTPANTVTSSTSFTVTTAPVAPHVMVIVEENQEYGAIIGSSNAPYINSLASTYTSATNWYAVEHNSPTDYLDLISGSDQGLGGTTKKTPPFSATNLVDELHSANIPWQGYMESMPSDCSTQGSNGLYDPIHNPFHFFTNYGSYCTSGSSEGVVPYPGSSGLVTALDGVSAPDFVFITPNDCNDMHGSTSGSTTCAGYSGSQLITAGDTWLKYNLGPVLKSTWFQNNGVVILTWDEGTTKLGLAGGSPPDDGSCTSPNVPECGGHVPTLVITANAAGSFTSAGDLYGALRGIEEAYGVGLLGHSSGTNDGDLEPAFGLGGSTTGGVTGQVTDQTDPSHPAISGAHVTCSCGGTLTTTTDGSGDYSFTNVTPGSGYGLSFSDTGYTTETIGSLSVTAGSTTTENEALPETGGVVSGTVTDATAPGNPPISGATVTCNCTTTPTTTTDSLGEYTFTEVTPGTAYTVSASGTGYTTGGTGSFTVTGGQASTAIDVSLAETGGAVSGTVTNANTSAGISGATVTCNCTSTPTTTTDSSGDYQFTQVTPGSGYTISVSAPAYVGASSGTFTVTSGTATTGIDVSLVPSPATIGVAQSFGAANLTSGTTLSASTGTATSGGDLLVAAIRDRNTTALATVTAVTDSAGNKWVRAAGVGKGQVDGEIWYAAAATSVTSVTVTVTSASAIAFTVLDVGGASSSPLDRTAAAAGSGITASTGTTAMTSVADEIVVADIGWNAKVTPSAQTAGYTVEPGIEQSTASGEAAGEQAAWQVLSSTGTQSFGATLSSSVAWTGVIATFEAG